MKISDVFAAAEERDQCAAQKKSIKAKVAHVKQAGQTRDHHCHWPGCTKQVPPAMWGCREHWYKLPANLRNHIWATYRPGQENTMTPSRAYLDVADQVQRWIKEHGGKR